MGIKSLTKFLRDNYPDVYDLIHISDFSFKKIAIDTTLYLCNYKALYGEEGWINAFIKLIASLRENDIHCVFIFDGGYPPEKEAERKERMEARMKQEEKVSRFEDSLDKYRETGVIDEILFDLEKNNNKNLLSKKRTIDINAIEGIVKKWRRQLFNITPKDYQITREIFDILKVPYFRAPMEAETMCAELCTLGKVDAVLTEDTDVLAYEAPVFLTKFNPVDGTCLQINYENVLKILELNRNQFLDFCIMCGTDYNKNIFKVGPSKALKLIQKFASIENIANNTVLDITPLNHIRSRELFREYKKSNKNVPYCGDPDFTALQVYICKKNIRINIDSLKKAFVREITIIE
jgi:5'-3' exonuclease